jgi:hypothetical protein
VTALAIKLAGPNSPSGPSAEAWDGDAQQAFSPLVERAATFVGATRDWMAGEKADGEFVSEVDQDLIAFRRAGDRVAALKTPKRFAIAHDMYEASARLYVETARVYRASVIQGDRTQLDLLGRRLRELADRVFDRGRAALGIANPGSPNVEVKQPEEVPIWTAEGLAAGPPLDDPPPPAATTPPLHQTTRPEQSRARWERAVAKAGAPSLSQLRGAIAGGRPVAQRDVARRYVAAAEYLRARPDPAGGREESARLRLAWLVAADAARAAQTVPVFGTVDLSDVGRQLERVAAMIWP